MLLLGLDLETTLEPKLEDRRIIEVGACLWDTETRAAVRLASNLIWDHQDQVNLDPQVTEITGITQTQLVSHGEDPNTVLEQLSRLLARADYVVAHNGNEFDFPMIGIAFTKFKIINPILNKIDTMTDVRYPDKIKTRKLTHLAAEHGFLNPFPHRALFDVMTMLKVLSHYDIHQVIEISKQPIVQYQAAVSYDDRLKAKEVGYFWIPKPVGLWCKNFKEGRLAQEVELASQKGFSIYRNKQVYARV